MENLVLAKLIKEITPEIAGRKVERVLGTPPSSLHIELERTGKDPEPFVTISLDPRFPALFALEAEIPEALAKWLKASAPKILSILSEVPADSLPEGFIRGMSASLRGAYVASIEQYDRDRVVKICFSKKRRESHLVLWIELFGRRPSAVLVEAPGERILACSREGTTSASGSLLRPGETYVPPSRKDKIGVESLSVDSLRSLVEGRAAEELSMLLSRKIKGLSPQTAAYVVRGITSEVSPPDAGTLLEGLKEVLLRSDERLRPTLKAGLNTSTGRFMEREKTSPKGRPVGTGADTAQMARPDSGDERGDASNLDLVLLPFGAPHWEELSSATMVFPTATDAIRSAFFHLCRWHAVHSAASMRRQVRALLGRLHNLRRSLQMDMTSAEKAADYRRMAELVLANLKTVKRGSTKLEVPDIHGEGETHICVDLDPSLSPSKNAERYFRRARKAERAFERVKSRLAAVERAAEVVKEFGEAIPEETSSSESALLAQGFNRIVDRLRARKTVDARHLKSLPVTFGARRGPVSPEGPATGRKPGRASQAAEREAPEPRQKSESSRRLRTRRRPSRDETGTAFSPRVFQTSDGYAVIVGRNSKQNDYITYRLAAPDDLWFHASGVPGSHVILRRKGKSDPSRKAIEEAAAVAAHFSKGRTSSAVPVVYTRRKYVHKPKGSRPGVATYSREKFIMAKPVKPKPAG
ncbi:MAG: hypothetical protein AMJ46_11315 [Latescibacteria bacterium DG_63]|nr:MAG: hypothetical protein AMJ46_11315 [Latescibacteria bacterium DG_63]